MYNFDEHNRAVSRYNNSREVSRPDTSRKPYFDRYAVLHRRLRGEATPLFFLGASNICSNKKI